MRNVLKILGILIVAGFIVACESPVNIETVESNSIGMDDQKAPINVMIQEIYNDSVYYDHDDEMIAAGNYNFIVRATDQKEDELTYSISIEETSEVYSASGNMIDDFASYYGRVYTSSHNFDFEAGKSYRITIDVEDRWGNGNSKIENITVF